MSEYLDELETERTMKDQFMARHAESPFVQSVDVRLPGPPVLSPGREVPDSRDARAPERAEGGVPPHEPGWASGDALARRSSGSRWGAALFGSRVYHAGEGVGTSVFIPFRDGTSGRESYGPGRYLTLELSESDTYELDFNRAFNPYCAYTDTFECGFPPAENDLPIPIRAGEKVWSAERNPRTRRAP